MICEEIKDVRNFMSVLLLKDTFDHFLAADIQLVTCNTFHIDGHLNSDFFQPDEFSQLPDQHMSYWKSLRPICYILIKGTKIPLKLKIIFALDREAIRSLITENDLAFSEEDINELFLNIKFENNILSCTTGCSLKNFTLDRSLEKAFDHQMQSLLEAISNQ